MSLRSLVIAMSAAAWCGGTLSAGMVEAFDYANQAEFQAVWRPWTAGGTSMLLTPDSHDGIGAVHGVATANYTMRNYRNLDDYDLYLGTDQSPVTFEYWLYDANPLLPNSPAGARNFNEIRAHAGNGLPSLSNNTSLQGLIALGLYNTPISDDNYHARIYGFGGLNSWYSLNTVRSQGWHRLTAQVGASWVKFLVDGQLDTTIPFADTSKTWAFDGVVLGSGLTSGGYDVGYDDLRVSKAPEPFSLLLIMAGGLLIRPHRAASR